MNEDEPKRTNEQLLATALAALEEFASRGPSNRIRMRDAIQRCKDELGTIEALRKHAAYLASQLDGELTYSNTEEPHVG